MSNNNNTTNNKAVVVKKKSKFDHWYLLKNTDGKKSISFTMVFYGFTAVTLWLVLSICEELLGVKIREFSGSEAMAYLTPIFSIYFFRKQQAGKTISDMVKEEETTSTTTEDNSGS